MRPRLLPLLLPAALTVLIACFSGGNVAPAGDGGAGDDGGSGIDAGTQPDTAACTGDATRCLSGTAALALFTATLKRPQANLFRVFPAGQVQPAASQLVAKDGTWAFAGLDPWAHYFVQIVVHFDVGGAQPATVARVVGPLAVPVASGAAPVAVQVKPVQLEVLETRAPGGALSLQWASAHVFDPASGAELQDATVAIVAGGATTPMPWATNLAGQKTYFAQFKANTAVAASYAITVSHASFGSSPVTFQLTADPPSFDGAITSPASGAAIPAGQPLVVTWGAQPSADFEVVEAFVKQGSSWSATYASPSPDAADASQETVPASAVPQAGSYLVQVSFTKASCPAAADGCVYGSSTPYAQVTAQ